MQLHAPTWLETTAFLWMFGCCPDRGEENIWDQLTHSKDPWPAVTRDECGCGGTEWIATALCQSPCLCRTLGAQGVTLRSPVPWVPGHSVQDPAGTGFSSACSLFLSCPDAKPNCSLPKEAPKMLLSIWHQKPYYAKSEPTQTESVQEIPFVSGGGSYSQGGNTTVALLLLSDRAVLWFFCCAALLGLCGCASSPQWLCVDNYSFAPW